MVGSTPTETAPTTEGICSVHRHYIALMLNEIDCTDLKKKTPNQNFEHLFFFSKLNKWEQFCDAERDNIYIPAFVYIYF